MTKLIIGKVNNERYYFPSDETALSEGMVPERFHDKLKNVINVPKGFSGVSGYGDNEHFSFKCTDLEYYKFMDFCSVYYEKLKVEFKNNPDDYMGTPESTYSNMKWAIADGTFNKDSPTFKKTCKELGIKHTYKAIKAFLEGEN